MYDSEFGEIKLWPGMGGIFFVLLFLIPGSANALQLNHAPVSSKLVIIQSDERLEYETAFRGIKDTVFAQYRDRIWANKPEQIFCSDYSGESKELLIGKVASLNPDILIAIGTPALKFSSHYLQAYPQIFCMVLEPERVLDNFPNTTNLTGIDLQIPLDVQLQTLKLIDPDAETIGLIHSINSMSFSMVEEFREEAKKIGIQLFAKEIEEINQLPEALNQVLAKADWLYLRPDSEIRLTETSDFILSAAARFGKPVIAPSPAYVSQGSVFSVSSDHYEIGRTVGQFVKTAVKSGRPLNEISWNQPQKVILTINCKVAKRLNLTLPDELLHRAVLIEVN